MLRSLIALQLVLLVACSRPEPGSAAEAEIRDMLATSAAAWNAGDLGGFMASYAHDTTTTFVGNHELLHGWDAIRNNYAALFETGAVRDSLRFEGVQVRLIQPELALGYARWVLVRNGDPVRSGPFTLVVQRRHGDWVIIHDHSSEDN